MGYGKRIFIWEISECERCKSLPGLTITCLLIIIFDEPYPDLKRSFRKKCTKDYATEQIRVIKDIMKWLRETMNSKK